MSRSPSLSQSHVRLGSNSEVAAGSSHFQFTPDIGHRSGRSAGPFWADFVETRLLKPKEIADSFSLSGWRFESMMGPRQVDQAALFYEFSLERHVPAGHLLRAIDRFVDLSDVRSHLAPFYSSTGRPSIDPELLVRMLLVGYCYGIRSERRLCEEVHLNLAYRWFCRLGLDGEVPDHSTFSKNRHGRFRDCDLLRKLFETVVRRCMAEGLVDGAAFAVDASLIAADANKQRSAAGSDDVDWEAIARTRRSVREGTAFNPRTGPRRCARHREDRCLCQVAP